MAETNEAAPKQVKRASQGQQAKIRRSKNILVAAEHDKGKLSKDAEKDLKAIKETVERIEEREAKRAKLLLEAERLTIELQDDYKTLTKHNSNMGRHADNAHGAGTPEAGAYRKDD